jgi:hypothetical protein
MQIQSVSVDDYISQIPEERQEIFRKMFQTINDNLPEGFTQGSSYGMIGWAVPLETYPDGYHCTPDRLCLSSALLPRKISLRCITWECMRNPNC